MTETTCPVCDGTGDDPRHTWGNVRLMVAWYDLWVGAFYDRRKRTLYLFPVPMVGLRIQFPGGAA